MVVIAVTQQAPPMYGRRMFHTIPGTAPSSTPTGGLPRTGGRLMHTLTAANDRATDLHAVAAHAPHVMRNAAFAGPTSGIPAATPGRSALNRQRVPVSTPALQIGVGSVAPKNSRSDMGRYVSTGQNGQMSSAQKIPTELLLRTKPVVPRFQF
jgi:hypothetical protein